MSIPGPEVEGPTVSIVTDSSGSSTDRSGRGFPAPGAAMWGASRYAGRQEVATERRAGYSRGCDEGFRAAQVVTGHVRGAFVTAAAVTTLARPLNSAAEVGATATAGKGDDSAGVAAATIETTSTTLTPAAVVVEGGGGRVVPSLSPPTRLDPGRPVIPGIPGAILEQQQQQQRRQQQLCRRYFSVEVHITEDGEAVYSFNKSAPARRGKWSRLEEEYAKRSVAFTVERDGREPGGGVILFILKVSFFTVVSGCCGNGRKKVWMGCCETQMFSPAHGETTVDAMQMFLSYEESEVEKMIVQPVPPTPPPTLSSPATLRIISDFDDGVLDAPVGIGLRQVLASKLRCEVMRVSKKFRGWQCVGKRNFQPVFYHDGRTAKVRRRLGLVLCVSVARREVSASCRLLRFQWKTGRSTQDTGLC